LHSTSRKSHSSSKANQRLGIFSNFKFKRLAFGISALAFLILIAVALYFSLASSVLQNAYQNAQFQVYPNTLDVTFDPQGDAQLHIRLDSDIVVHNLAVDAILDPEVWEITTGSGIPLASHITIPERSLYTNRRCSMTLDTPVTVENIDVWRRGIQMLSSPEGLDEDLGIIEIRSKISANLHGARKLSDMSISKMLDFRGASFKKLLDLVIRHLTSTKGTHWRSMLREYIFYLRIKFD
jgi:hypothetical protein